MAPYTSTTSTTTYGSTSGSFVTWSRYTPVYYIEEEWIYQPESDSYRTTITGTVVGHEQVERFGTAIDNLTKDQIAKDKKILDEVLKRVNDRPQFNEVRQSNVIDYKEVIK